MYANAQSQVRVGEGFSKEFEVKVGVHQGSVLSPLLFIIVLEALSREFQAGVPWEDLHADNLVIIADSLEECVRRLLVWKEAMEKKGLRVNAGKTKVLQGFFLQFWEGALGPFRLGKISAVNHYFGKFSKQTRTAFLVSLKTKLAITHTIAIKLKENRMQF